MLCLSSRDFTEQVCNCMWAPRIKPWDAQTLRMETHIQTKFMHPTIILLSNDMAQKPIPMIVAQKNVSISWSCHQHNVQC